MTTSDKGNASKDKLCSLVLLRRTAADGHEEILLAMKKRGFGAGRWNGAGGKVEKGETIEQGMVREAIEEINIVPRAYEKVAVLDFTMDANTGSPWHMHGHVFVCYAWDGEPEESEEMTPRWFRLADIPYEEMWQDDIYWLPAVLAGQKLECGFSFDEAESMLSASIRPVSKLR